MDLAQKIINYPLQYKDLLQETLAFQLVLIKTILDEYAAKCEYVHFTTKFDIVSSERYLITLIEQHNAPSLSTPSYNAQSPIVKALNVSINDKVYMVQMLPHVASLIKKTDSINNAFKVAPVEFQGFSSTDTGFAVSTKPEHFALIIDKFINQQYTTQALYDKALFEYNVSTQKDSLDSSIYQPPLTPTDDSPSKNEKFKL